MTLAGDTSQPAEAARFFDRTAEQYDSAYADRGAGGRVLRSRAGATVELLGDEPGAVLDAGMGGGVICAALDARGWTVSGLDLSPVMVQRASARLPQLRERLVVGSITELPFGDCSFDAVVATGVLEYVVPELARAVSELARVLRPGGTAVVSFPNYRAPMIVARGRLLYPIVRAAKRILPTRRPAPQRLVRLRFEELRGCLEHEGLRVDEVRATGARPLPAALAEKVEAGGSRLAFLLATQYVVRARKAAV